VTSFSYAIGVDRRLGGGAEIVGVVRQASEGFVGVADLAEELAKRCGCGPQGVEGGSGVVVADLKEGEASGGDIQEAAAAVAGGAVQGNLADVIAARR
jgi:hypothetical protein